MIYIEVTIKNVEHKIPNSWDALNDKQFTYLMGLINQVSEGKLSVGVSKVKYVAYVLGIELNRKTGEDLLATLTVIAEKVTFIYKIVYEGDVMKNLPDDVYKLAQQMPPERLPDSVYKKILLQKEYKYVVSDCFCHNPLPELTIDNKVYQGYHINTGYAAITCDLTAIQFVEAQYLLADPDQWPLLASVLYREAGREYDSNYAHHQARIFEQLPPATLQGIVIVFQAFCNYLFTKTNYKILTQGREVKKAISLGGLEALYGLTNDGLGDINTVQKMDVIQYLTILRKKTIEAVQSLHAAKMEKVDISSETGLPLDVINQIV